MKPSRWRREDRKQEAKERKEARAKRTPQQQIEIIKSRRGESQKEWLRLQQEISFTEQVEHSKHKKKDRKDGHLEEEG